MEEQVAIGKPTAEHGVEGDVETWAVELKEARKTYRTGPIEIPALRGVSLRIAPGEFLAIAGPSGSGKTTLLNIIGGLDRADDGEVWVEGKNLQLLSSGELAHMRLERLGFVFQAYNLLNSPCSCRVFLWRGVEKECRNCFWKSVSLVLKIVVQQSYPADNSSGLPWLGPWSQNLC